MQGVCVVMAGRVCVRGARGGEPGAGEPGAGEPGAGERRAGERGAGERAARGLVLRAAGHSLLWPAIAHFLFHELTLQGCVLAGAVGFIFLGLDAACAALAPPAAAAVLVALAVWTTHRRHTRDQELKLCDEEVGLVAEYCAPPGDRHEIVGTASVSQYWGPRRSGWLHALAVMPRWRGRGVGRALVEAARRQAEDAGLESLEAVTSQLQPGARGLLHAAGWRVRGQYHRRLVGSALTLQMTALGLELPARHLREDGAKYDITGISRQLETEY